MRIVTQFIYPPIPTRDFDWEAVDDETYSGDESDPIGRGRTERAAVEDLLEQIETQIEVKLLRQRAIIR